jgi:large subunit ribosomal protein L9
MKVILLQNVKGLGLKGDVKETSYGYANNMLFPRKLAKLATEEEIKHLQKSKKQEEEKNEIHNQLIKKIMSELNEQIVSMEEKVNEQGHLYAQVNEKEIVAAVKKEKGIDIDISWVKIEEPIKTTGEHKIKLVEGNNHAEFLVNIKSGE